MSHDVMTEVTAGAEGASLQAAPQAENLAPAAETLPPATSAPAPTATAPPTTAPTNGTVHRPYDGENAAATSHPTTKASCGSSTTALQDLFLNGLRRENIDVVVYFCDGSQERGAIRAFDTFTVLLENRNSGKAQLLYKHAIARIFPTRTPAQLFASDRTGKK